MRFFAPDNAPDSGLLIGCSVDINQGDDVYKSKLFSVISANKNFEPVIIESLDFNHEFFQNDSTEKIENLSEVEIIDFIEDLYQHTDAKSLYPDRKNQFEYSKYYFTNHHINQDYFKINIEDEYKIIDH